VPGITPLQFDQFSNLTFLKISALLLFGEDDLMFGDEERGREWTDAEGQRIQDSLISALPPNMQKFHVTECMQMIMLDNAAYLFARVVQDAPLERFHELHMIGAGYGDHLSSEYIDFAAPITSACMHRGINFKLIILPLNYYFRDLPYERG
jgi:hypothetical protein